MKDKINNLYGFTDITPDMYNYYYIPEPIKLTKLEKIKYFFETNKINFIIAFLAICEFLILYDEPSLIPVAIAQFSYAFLYTFIMLRLS